MMRSPIALALLAIVALLAVGEALSPGFARGDQVVRLLTVAAILGIVAAGQTLVVLGGRGGIDLSVGMLVSCGAAIAGNVMDGQDGAIVLAVLAAGGATFAVGLVNGLGVAVLGIPPLVMTLGMMAVGQGALVVASQGVPSGRAAPALMAFVQPGATGVPGILLVWAAIAVAMAVLLRRTSFGLALYAVGANDRAAGLLGLRVGRIRCLLYGASGMFAGLAGVCVIGYTGTSFISVGDQYVLPSIIAVVIGGTSLAGGAGGYFGTVLGAVALVLLQSVLTTVQMEAWGRQVIFGLTLLGLMLLYGRQTRLRA